MSGHKVKYTELIFRITETWKWTIITPRWESEEKVKVTSKQKKIKKQVTTTTT